MLWGCIVALNACSSKIHKANDFAYRYTLVATESIEHYGVSGINGPRSVDIPIGDTLVAESASLFTGVPAYSQVIYQQKKFGCSVLCQKLELSKKEKYCLLITRSIL